MTNDLYNEIKYNVLDSLMGSGKTEYFIQTMNEADKREKFIFVTPYLDEVTRIKESVTERIMNEPSNEGSTKEDDLFQLMRQGKSIVTTHALFTQISNNEKFITYFERNDYTLILDEILDVVDDLKDISEPDVLFLKDHTDLIELDDQGGVTWVGDEIPAGGTYSDVYKYSQLGVLYIVKDQAFIRLFNKRLLNAFDKAYIGTYLFQHSQMRMLLNHYDIDYTTNAIKYNADNERYEVVEHDVFNESRAEIYEMMNIHEGKYNDRFKDIGVTRLSFNQLNEEVRKATKPNATEQDKLFWSEASATLNAFFRSCERRFGKAEVRYTTLKDGKELLKPKDFWKKTDPNRYWMSTSEKGTNKFIETKYFAYVYEKNIHPNRDEFFHSRGYGVDDEGFAVAEVLQTIFRTRIRRGEEIQLLIPSRKMRTALLKWSKFKL